MRTISPKYFLLFGLLLILAGCSKENVYIYEVNPVEVSSGSAEKPNVKTDEEFISISYSDVFGATIPQSELEDLSLSYRSFGDKRLIIDMIIRNFLNDPDALVPSASEMRADPGAFVVDTYKKFLVRQPNEFERWFLKDKIEANESITPELIYYSFMTCSEYRFY